MTVEAVKTALATVEAGITGVIRAEKDPPRTIASADMPLFLNFTGPATYAYNPIPGTKLIRETRVYFLRLYVMGTGQGAEYEAEVKAQPFFERVRAAFYANATLKAVSTVERARLIGDTGIQVLGYFGTEFLGVEWQLQVSELVQATCT